MGEEMAPIEFEKFLATLQGKPILFANNVKIKDVEKDKFREQTNVSELDDGKMKGELYPNSFSLTATIEPSRGLNKLLGRYRLNRGSSRTPGQKWSRYRYYLAKINRFK